MHVQDSPAAQSGAEGRGSGRDPEGEGQGYDVPAERYRRGGRRESSGEGR